MTTFDVIIIGGGPGGYVAALRGASEGLKVALIEAGQLGGTCLNQGCIPSKTFLKNAEILEEIEQGKQRGIIVKDVEFSMEGMVAYKNSVLNNLRMGIQSLLKTRKVEVFNGLGSIKNPQEVEVISNNEKTTLSTKNIIIATGSRPFIPKMEGLEKVKYHTTDTIFDLKTLPSSITIVGGGVIGVELADVFHSLGSKVTIIEYSNRIIAMEDEEASKVLHKKLHEKGINILTEHLVTSMSEENGLKTLKVEKKSGEKVVVSSEELLMAVGRTPNDSATKQLGLAYNGAFIKVNDYLQTNISNIYAVGDVIGGYQLAHVASAEGLTVIENILGKQKKIDYSIVPRCIYTNLQIASIGQSENDLKSKGIDYTVTKYNLFGNGKAQTLGKKDGFVKVFTDSKYGEIYGMCMVGPYVTELIGQGSAYMSLEGTVYEMAEMIQPHPSLSEIFMEVANLSIGKGVH
ncbi:dihydrolipoyl dehydrogenase [Lysinibacillus agricola]|uniref:Dihydrolipoyl dehydrogenase n=1 Tax=Lysinibacillus agricola TaxID=2590012 RepID=A0ABX7ARB1_9BACI|nr:MULTISPECIES: dihydrolipoyl dehydrogenase [Lysinibacillus]KOS61125.1 acetoin dehydrogenase [Lysinibacillus sp. FJAT-14222]QQP12503.1 dihydrolipoyl dehydrogenase [Lysinibacillus agricola]